MNVFIHVGRKQYAMRFTRIANFDLRHVGCAPERSGCIVDKPENDDEVVDALESAIELLTRWKRYGGRDGISAAAPSSPTASKPVILELRGVGHSGPDARHISGCRVTGTAI